MAQKTTHATLVTRLGSIDKKIAELKKKKYEYKTGERMLAGMGIICEMDTEIELLHTMSYILDKEGRLSEAAQILGIDLEKLANEEDEPITPTVCGYTCEEWKADIKTRLEQIRDQKKLQTLIAGMANYEGVMTEEDRFNRIAASTDAMLDGILDEDDVETAVEEQVEE